MMSRLIAPLPAPLNLFKSAARPLTRALSEVPVHTRMISQRDKGEPLAVFLPAYGRKEAALLRIYNVAEALRPRGWRTLVLSPRLSLRQRQRILASVRPDVVVMQGARHALNRPEFYPDQTVVFDMDDADFHLPHLSGPVRRAMPRTAAVIAGSGYVADWCRQAGARDVHVVWTGSPPSGRTCPPQIARPLVLAWAQTRPATYTAEADFVRAFITRLAVLHPHITLRLYDRQPTDSDAFARSFYTRGLTVEWRSASRYASYLSSFDDVAIGLAPLIGEAPFTRGKSFGKVLAYLDSHVPVIASDAGEHGRFFDARTAVVSNHLEFWVNSADRLLREPQRRAAMAEAAYDRFLADLSLDAAARQVGDVLQRHRGNLERSIIAA